jgi:hypothetical protein
MLSTGFRDSPPARAEVVDVIVSGTVMSGVDSTGVFGSMGVNLAGSTFIAVFSYDPSLGYSVGNVVTPVVIGAESELRSQ